MIKISRRYRSFRLDNFANFVEHLSITNIYKNLPFYKYLLFYIEDNLNLKLIPSAWSTNDFIKTENYIKTKVDLKINFFDYQIIVKTPFYKKRKIFKNDLVIPNIFDFCKA